MRLFLNLTFALLLPSVFLGACQQEDAWDCVKATGPIQTETRPLPPFQTLRIFDNLQVTVIADSTHFAEVTAGKNLHSNILTEVRNGELTVRNINKCNWVRSYDKPLQVRLHAVKLKDVFHDGEGRLQSENQFPADTLFLHVTGAGDTDLHLQTQSLWLDMYELGDVYLSGTNQHLTAYVLSTGSLKAEGLRNREAFVKVADQGQAFLQVSGQLTAEINGPGNVFYLGTPANLKTSGTGPGELKKLQ